MLFSRQENAYQRRNQDEGCSHLEAVFRTTFTFTTNSCWERPLDLRMALMFSLSIGAHSFRFPL